MRALLLLVLVLTGCKSLPSVYSARQQFERENPSVAVLRVTKCEVSEPGSLSHADFVFECRDQSGSLKEETWHYRMFEYGWYRVQEDTKR